MMRAALLLFAAPILLANGDPGTIPPPVKAMLDAAMASGDEAEVTTIAKYASTVAPESAAQIRKIASDWREAKRAAAAKTLREADFLDLMRGRVELGGFVTTGNTDTVGVTAAVDLTREGYRWRHKGKMLAEYQESAGIVSREHYLVAYEPNLKIDDRLYAYGALQFEADRLLGYTERYSASAGAGYTAIKSPTMSLDVELGPAFRATDFTDFSMEREFGARGSLDFDWRLSRGVTLSQDASAYLQNANSTVTGKTALAARLFGPLSAQLSYAVSFESDPPAGRVNTDTTSRASLVYAF